MRGAVTATPRLHTPLHTPPAAVFTQTFASPQLLHSSTVVELLVAERTAFGRRTARLAASHLARQIFK